MKKDLPNVIVGILLGLLIAWLLGLFSPVAAPSAGPAAKTADATTTPAQPASPAAAGKGTPTSVVAAPVAQPAKVAPSTKSQPATAATMQAAQMDQVRQQSRVKAITNNLRQLSAAAQQYMLDKGVTSAGYFDLVGNGTDDYIRNVSPVMGEDYTGIYINQSDTQVMVVTPDGTVVTYDQ